MFESFLNQMKRKSINKYWPQITVSDDIEYCILSNEAIPAVDRIEPDSPLTPNGEEGEVQLSNGFSTRIAW